MRKIAVSFALFFVFCFGLGFSSLLPIKQSVHAQEKELVTILGTNFASNIDSHGIDSSEVDDFTPFNTTTELSRLSGNSYTPNTTGTGSGKHIDSIITVDGNVQTYESQTALDSQELALEMWINFDMKTNIVPRALTIQISSGDANKLVWTLDVNTIKSLTKKTKASSSDKSLFGTTENVPIGWVKLTLPFKNATETGSIIDDKKFTFNKFKITQTGEDNTEQKLGFYDIKIIKLASTSTVISSEIQDYSYVITKQNAKVSNEEDKYYIGETFPQFMSASEVYSVCWVGRINYLENDNYDKLKIMTDNGIGNSSSVYYSYGASDFILESASYTISYGLMYDNKFAGFLTDKIYVQNYGKGVWIESDTTKIEIGKTQKLYFKIHDAFRDANITFTSSDENVLKIKEVNVLNKYIIVETVSIGDATINILVVDDRLAGTEFEETGLTNGDFKVEVVKEQKKANTTVIMLWVGLGILVAGLIYLAVKAIMDARKVEVK